MKHVLKPLIDGRYGRHTFGHIVLIRNGDDVDIYFRDERGRVRGLLCQGAGERLMPEEKHGDEVVLAASLVESKEADLSPKAFIGNSFSSVFGCVEFENLAAQIVTYLADDTRQPTGAIAEPINDDTGWSKRFTIEDLRLSRPPGFPANGDAFAANATMLVAFACAGWLEHVWFPKGRFRVTRAFVERLQERL